MLKKYGVVINSEQYKELADVFVVIWGSGKPLREFLWSEEMADTCVFIMQKVEFKYLIQEGAKRLFKSSGRQIELISLKE